MGLGDAAAKEAVARKKRTAKPFVWTEDSARRLKEGREIMEVDPEYSDDDMGPRTYGARKKKYESEMGSGVYTYTNDDLTPAARKRRERTSRYPRAFTTKDAGDALAGDD